MRLERSRLFPGEIENLGVFTRTRDVARPRNGLNAMA
jgi:hypothetical protein